MTTIRIADDLRPVRSESSNFRQHHGDRRYAGGGIYNTRALSRASSRVSIDRLSDFHLDTEEGDEWRDGHTKTKQVFGGTTLLWYVHRPAPAALPRGLLIRAGKVSIPVDWGN